MLGRPKLLNTSFDVLIEINCLPWTWAVVIFGAEAAIVMLEQVHLFWNRGLFRNWAHCLEFKLRNCARCFGRVVGGGGGGQWQELSALFQNRDWGVGIGQWQELGSLFRNRT